MDAHERGLHEALKIAAHSSCQFRVGAAFVRRKGNVLSACNVSARDAVPRALAGVWAPWLSIHAEIALILRAARLGWTTQDSTLYVARSLRVDPWVGNAAPCPDCRRAVVLAGVRLVVSTYTPTTYGKWCLKTGESTFVSTEAFSRESPRGGRVGR